MRRSPKRIVAPLFLLLVAAMLFVPRARGDELLKFACCGTPSEWTWTLPQDAVPDQGSVASGDFQFSLVPVFVSFIPSTGIGKVQTFDAHFFMLTGTTNFQLTCDPWIFGGPDADKVCDYSNWLQTHGDPGIWSAGPNNSVFFHPGSYFGGGLIISEATATPEPSTLALLMSFATLFLLAVGVRPSHR